jgi:hypothetical protein
MSALAVDVESLHALRWGVTRTCRRLLVCEQRPETALDEVLIG